MKRLILIKGKVDLRF